MAILIDMPKLSDTMEEGVIAKWNVKEGDQVNSGDIIAEVDTDKATMDVEVFDSGTILKIFAKEGEAVALGGKMAIIGEKGEDISSMLDDDSSDDAPKKKESSKESKGSKKSSDEKDDKEFDPLFGDLEKDEKKESKESESSSSESSDSDDSRLKASPLAKKMAKDQGIKLSDVKGSGPNGRIIKKDIESFDKTAKPAKQETKSTADSKSAVASHEDTPVSQMRKVIARRLSESKFTNPHFYETIDIDMKEAISIRTKLNESPDVKVSFNDLVVKAAGVALSRHPKVNSSWMGDFIRQYNEVHVAVAVAVPDGLVTPVVRNADKLGLSAIGAQVKEFAQKAKDKKLQPDEMEGSTFTISNLGMFGIEEFTAIINPPNACIMAVGAIRDVPVVENGAVVPGKRMKVTLSSDHRIVDGASAAEFLQTFRKLMEHPMNMLL